MPPLLGTLVALSTALFLLILRADAGGFDGRFDVNVQEDQNLGFLGKFAFAQLKEVQPKFNYSGTVSIDVWTDHPNCWLFIFYDDDSRRGKQIHYYKKIVPQHPHGDDDFDQPPRPWHVDLQVTNEVLRRWWYMYIFDPDHEFDGRFRSHFRQVDGSEFSADMQGIMEVHLIAFFCWCAIARTLHWTFIPTVQRHSCYHSVVQAYVRCMQMTGAAAALVCMHYLKFEHDGVGLRPFLYLGKALYAAGHVGFVVVLLCLSKGWMVSTAELTDKPVIAVLGLALMGCYAMAAAWRLLAEDPADYWYVYDTYPGVAISLVHCMCALLFAVWAHHSAVTEPVPEKAQFFWLLLALFLPFLLGIPVLALVAYAVDNAYRDFYCEAAETFTSTVFMTLLGVMLLPAGDPHDPMQPNGVDEDSRCAAEYGEDSGRRTHDPIEPSDQDQLRGATRHYNDL
jgi:hypothetical protein